MYTNKDFDKSDEASYLVIGRGDVRKEDDYVNYPTKDKSINNSVATENLVSSSTNVKMAPETSSNSTTFTVAPSVSSSSSSSVPASVAPLSPVVMDYDLQSPGAMHDSTISRLIDAVSLGNEQDTCGSVSALIGQFDQNDLSALSPDRVPSRHSNFRPATPKVLQDLRSPLKTDLASPITKPPMIPQQAPPSNPVLLSSPETTELEDVYTILDEEVLSPGSEYNLREQAVSFPVDASSISMANGVQGIGTTHIVGLDDMYRKQCEDIEEVEERIYEEVNDLPSPEPAVEQGSSQTHMRLVNNSFQFVHNTARNTFTEVEINVDEDPLDAMLTSAKYSSQWEGLTSPTKRHAIYQNHEPVPNYPQHKHPASYCDSPQYQSYPSHAAYPHSPSPVNQPSYQLHGHPNNSQPSPFHRPNNSRPSNTTQPCHNGYSMNNGSSNSGISGSYQQQRGYGGSQILNSSQQSRQGPDPKESKPTRIFHNGFSSSEHLHGKSAVSATRDPERFTPSSDIDALYSLPTLSKLAAPEGTNLRTQPQNPQSWNQKVSVNSPRNQPLSKPRLLSTRSQSVPIDSTAPSQCKSKSLGDLTSEDISCNFQSKYNIISRSFITPHMKKQRRMGTTGCATLQTQSCDPLTEQLRRLVSLEADVSDSDCGQPPRLHQDTSLSMSQQQETSRSPALVGDAVDSPPPLTRRLSSRSQSRVRHINSRARERQQEALKPRPGVMVNGNTGIGGVVFRNKPASQNPSANRHSTGSYIVGYLDQMEDRGLPEGACTSLHYGHGDHYGDRYYTDDSLPNANFSHSASEPEVYFLLRL